jgi:ketosteroid isomerase-like protein
MNAVSRAGTPRLSDQCASLARGYDRGVQRNADVLRRAFDAINQRDIDLALSEFADDVLIDFSRTIGPYQDVYRGKAEAVRPFKDFLEIWDEILFVAEEMRELGDDRIVLTVLVRVAGRGGLRAEARGGQVWRFRDSKVIEICVFQSRRHADAALTS